MELLLLKTLFIILHITTAAAWFGLALRLGARSRMAVSLPRPAALVVANDLGRTLWLMGLFLILTLIFGLGAFFLGGGFASHGPAYHTSLLLIFILIGMHYGLVRPAWGRLRAACDGEAGPVPPEAAAHPKRIAMLSGIGHLLWLTMLVLMFWHRIAP